MSALVSKTAPPTMGSAIPSRTTPSALGSCKAPKGHFVFVDEDEVKQAGPSPTGEIEGITKSTSPHPGVDEDGPQGLACMGTLISLSKESRRYGQPLENKSFVATVPFTGVRLADLVLTDKRSMIRSMFGPEGRYRTRLGTVVAFNSSSVGVLNSVISNSNIASLTEWSSFASLFDEFFVHQTWVRFEPRNRYQFPVTAGPSVSTCNCLLTVTPLFHGTSGYASAATAMNNRLTAVQSTADPFTFVWVNNERSSQGVVVSPTTSLPLPTQSWCLTTSAAASLYTGQIQLLGATAVGPATGVVTVGDIAVLYDISFRVRA
jgi:hypothetical protein